MRQPLLATPSRRIHERRDSDPLPVDTLITDVHLVFRNAGIAVSNSKVSRLVRAYKHRAERNGFDFIDYLVTSINMDAWRRKVVADELRTVVAYADPTGELAVRNVMRAHS